MARTLNVVPFPAPTKSAASRPVPVRGRTLLFRVDNMHCGGCLRTVEQALAAVPGVASARANLSTRRVTVVTEGSNPGNTEPLLDALRKAGYAAAELGDDGLADGPSDHELVKRLAVAGFASANIMLLSVAVWAGRSGQEMDPSLQTLMHWLSALIAVPAVAYAGTPFFSSAIASLRARSINMDVPISLGVVLATGMSLYQTMQSSEQVYFDAAVSLLFFLLIGRVLDQRMRRQATSAAENLLGLVSPATTIINPDGTSQRVATRTVTPGMRLLIAAGERVPVDARLAHGAAEVDESLISGETVPRKVSEGEPLYCGTVNLTGPVEAIATACEDNTLLAEIGRLMQAAEQARGHYVRLADRAARLYAPAVHILGLVTYIGWIWTGHGWQPALTAAIAVLIITCPCALALAVPAVQVAAVGRLFKHGVIVKVPDGLERLAEVNTVIFDKTGTLTVGEPRLEDPASHDDATLLLAASLAAASRHPYSRAVMRACADRGLTAVPAQEVEEISGSGLRAVAGGQTIKLGSAAFCGADAGAGARPTLWLRRGSDTPVAFHFHDPLRADAADVSRRLRGLGYEVELLSGDRTAIVEEAARACGIDRWEAEVRPDRKVARIEELARAGRKVLMVGDGLNDAPALAAGHASMAPASATDITQTSADAVFQGARLAPLIETLAVAKAARRAAEANFAIAIAYNIAFVPLAMMGVVTPLIAAIAMSASSISVTANAIWLGHRRLKDAS